jgi:hypothetical protein
MLRDPAAQIISNLVKISQGDGMNAALRSLNSILQFGLPKIQP